MHAAAFPGRGPSATPPTVFTVDLELTGEIFTWRGPSPFHFVRVPEDQVAALRTVAREVTYGGGMIPVEMGLGSTVWETSLWPKDGGYLVPVKDEVREAEGVDEGDVVTLRLTVRPRR
jgi:hypothetical protein